MAFKRQKGSVIGSNRFDHSGRRPRRKFSIDEEVIEIDSEKDPSTNITDILVHLARHASLSKSRILAYLNGLVRYYTELTAHGRHIEFGERQIIFCLRGCTLHKYSVVRAAAFRCLRYIIDSADKVHIFFELKIDWCVARSLDIHLSYDSERTQAIRLCRHLVQLHPVSLQPSIILPFVALAEDSSKANERMVLMGLELLCELAYSNPRLLAKCGGVQIIVQHIIQCHNSTRINEALLQTLLHLLNNSQTRSCCSPISGLDQLVAPFTDSLYKHTRDTNDTSVERGEEKQAKFQEQRLLRCKACAQALLSALHTWPGLVILSSPHNTAISSLVNALQLSSHPTQKVLLQLMYDVFLLSSPDVTEDFEAALKSCDPCTPDSSWKLQEGFVAAECLALHKEVSSRPNLVDNHLALLLSTFIAYGLMEALCEVVIESDGANSISATILLGELLHMSFLLLPWGDSEQTHFLPSLVAASHSTTHTRAQRSQAHKAVEYLDRLHSLKKRGRVASSLHLELLISFIPEAETISNRNQKHKSAKDKLKSHLPQDTEETILQLIRDSGVLVEQNALKWRWFMVKSILQCNELTLRRVEDYSLHRFLSKLLHFYNPGADNGFCTIRLDDSKARLYTSIGLLLLEKILLIDADESHRHLCSLLVDICHSLTEIRQEVPTPEAKLGLKYIYTHCCQNYFLFIGKLSQLNEGQAVLESTGIMQLLLDLVTITSQEVYVKLTVSSLDYTKDGMCRIILSKALTATSENARLYTADFMRALLRLGVPYFSNWCMDLLITQLYDQSKNVSMRSLSVINEACENQTNLRSLINIRPSILHLGTLSSLLVTRYLSITEGFLFLQSTNYLHEELTKWHESLNVKYTEVVDDMLAQSLSSYEKSYDDQVLRRSSAVRRLGKSVYIPAHLYGQLIQHSEGAEIVSNLPYLSDYFDVIRNDCLQDDVDLKQSKAAIWAIGHIGSSVFGLGLLDKQGIIPSLIDIAEKSPLLTLRGTAYYALGLVASTQGGVHRLAEHGWRAVMNHRSEEWPVANSQMLFSDPDAVREIRSLSDGSSISQGSARSDSTDRDSSRYEIDEGARSRASTDERVDKMRQDVNEQLYEQSTSSGDFESAVKSGKAHSTSELMKGSKQDSVHRRSSSDSCRTWNLDVLPTTVLEDDKSSNEQLTSSASLMNGGGDTSIDTLVIDVESVSQQSTPVKPAIRHKTSKSLVDMGSDSLHTPSKSRSLSWRSDVRGSHSMNDMLRNSPSLASTGELHQMSSMDSAISQTSISPIDTERASTSLVLVGHTMSLNREKKGKALKRKKRFSSLQSQLIKHESTSRGIYITQRDEIGQAAVRTMRRQASTTMSSSASNSSLTLLNSPAIVSPSSRASNSHKIIRTLSAKGDMDTLCKARRFSDMSEPVLSFAVKYMGLALPLDIIDLFELPDCQQGDTSATLLSAEDLEPVNRTIAGLQLHSTSNCVQCVSLFRDYTEINGDVKELGEEKESIYLDRHIDGKISETGLVGRSLLRKECIRFITTICSSIGVHAAEEGLLRLREQFPDLFNDLCLYSEVCSILSTYQFHLPARRFIQELFQDTSFDQIFTEVINSLKTDLTRPCCDKHKSEIKSEASAS